MMPGAPQGPSPVQSTPDGTEYSAPADQPAAPCSHIDVRPTGSGFVATCFYKAATQQGPKDRSAGVRKPEEHAFPTFDALVAYLGQELGVQPQPDDASSGDGGGGSDDGGDDGAGQS